MASMKERHQDPLDISATFFSIQCGITVTRVAQLAKEGIIEKLPNGRYAPESVAKYIEFKISASEKRGTYDEELVKEKWRKEKRLNDEAEELLIPIDTLREVFEKVSGIIVEKLTSIPVEIKRRWPEVTAAQLLLVEKVIVNIRNSIADINIDSESD